MEQGHVIRHKHFAEGMSVRLLDVYLEGDIEQADYSRKKGKLLHEKTGSRERIRRIEREGSAWLEPILDRANCGEFRYESGRASIQRTCGREFIWSRRRTSPTRPARNAPKK